MANQIEGFVLGDGLKAELPMDASRATETIVSGAGVIPIFRVLGRITASGLLTNYTPGAANGSEVAVAVAIEGVDATAAAATINTIDWTATFARQRLSWGAAVTTDAHRTTAIRQLQNRGIRVLNQA
jgi:hypothetical protein